MRINSGFYILRKENTYTANKVYECKDGRVRIYIQDEKRVMSYPKYLMEVELGRVLLPNEEVHHKDENPLNNDLSNLELRVHG